MKKNQTHTFLSTLQTEAKKQSRLHHTSPLPSFTHPVSAFIGMYPWQTLAALSFCIAWMMLLWWFDFFFTIVRSIVI